MSEEKFRIESDLLGELQVPVDAYYGVQTQRAINNYKISNTRMCDYPEYVIAMACIKLAAAQTNKELGAMDGKIADAIVEACREIIDGKFHDQFPVDMMQGGAGTSVNMNANEVIANRALEIMGHKKGEYQFCSPNDHVNCAQSTNDAYPSAFRYAFIRMNRNLEKALKDLIDAFKAKGEEFKDVIKMGRTQLQDAVPIRLGHVFHGYESMVSRDRKRIEKAHREMYTVNLGGTAVGTAINVSDSYFYKIVPNLEKITGYPLKQAEDLFDATENLDGFVAVSGVVKTCAVDLSKMCNDLRLMSSGPKTGFGEINLPAKQNGSSIMPGKVNPVIPEVVSQVAFHIVGHDTTITMAAEAGQLELNAFEPVVFCNLFESITTLEKAVDTLIVNCITGITANRKHCKDLMESSAGIATALCPHIGYKASAAIAKTAVKTGKSVRELVLEQGLMKEKELEEVLDPYLMTEVGEERKEDEVRRKAC